MTRLKITGYIDTNELEEGEVDEMSPTGLSEEGYMNLVNGENGQPLSLADMHDVSIRVER
jgi:hypothetical protein